MEEKKDDDIEIDWKKMKGWFSSKKEVKEESHHEKKEDVPHEVHKHHDNMEKKDDDLSIDFSKLKRMFRSSDDKKTDDSVDLSSLKGFFTSTLPEFFKKYGIYFLVLIPLILSIFLRITPAFLPVTDDWAQNVVYQSYKDQIGTQLRQQYPNLPNANIQAQVNKEFDSYLSTNKAQIDKDVQSASQYFKSQFQDENGDTYLIAIDPYFWLRHARNIITNGHPGDELRDGKPYDTYMNAPNGRFVPADMFHAYLIAYSYKIFSLFSNVSMARVAFFLPVLLSALAVIPVFFVARKIAGDFGGLITGIIVAIHPAFLVRTMAGISDTDGYNVLFPLLATWLFIEAMETDSHKWRIALTVLNGFFIGIYAFAWSGWWYIFDFLLASAVCYMVYYLLIHRDELKTGKLFSQSAIKNSFVFLLIFFISSGVFVTAFTTWDIFAKSTLYRPLGFTRLKEVGIDTVWPNVYTTVAEQTPASLNSVISQTGIGSLFLFFISLLGMIFLLVRSAKSGETKWWSIAAAGLWYVVILVLRPQNLLVFLALISVPLIYLILYSLVKKESVVDIKLALLLIMWYGATIYASTKGVRFTLLLVPAFALAIGISFGNLYDIFSNMIRDLLKIDRRVARISVVFILGIFLIYPVNVFASAFQTSNGQITDLSDGWYNSLQKIDRETPRNSIVTSWWDYGHWFKYIANRPVTFDGTSQDSPPAHWVGKILSTSNETLAVGILRMLDCGANTAYEKLLPTINDVPRTIDLINQIVVLDKDAAKKLIVSKGFTDNQAEDVLKYTHCTPPTAFFIASDDMVGKSGVWAHFGNWNFDRALMYNTLKKSEYQNDFRKGVEFLGERFNYSEQKASSAAYEVQNLKTSDDANNWIAPWPSYQSGARKCARNNTTLTCDLAQGLQASINLDTLQVDIPTNQGTLHPNALWLATKDGMKERRFNDTLGVSIVVYPDSDGYKTIVVSPEIAGSMFTRMFFLGGHSLTHFEHFSTQNTITGGKVYIYKVNWEGGAMNIMDTFKPKTPMNATVSP